MSGAVKPDTTCVHQAPRRCVEAHALADTRKTGHGRRAQRALRQKRPLGARRAQQTGHTSHAGESTIGAALVEHDDRCDRRMMSQNACVGRRRHHVNRTLRSQSFKQRRGQDHVAKE